MEYAALYFLTVLLTKVFVSLDAFWFVEGAFFSCCCLTGWVHLLLQSDWLKLLPSLLVCWLVCFLLALLLDCCCDYVWVDLFVSTDWLVGCDCWLTVWWLVSDCWMTAWWLVSDCWMIAWWLVSDCWMIAWWLVSNCWMIAWWLVSNCWINAWWLVCNCWLIDWLIVEGFGLRIMWGVSANQNVINDAPREKPEQWPPWLPHKLKQSNRAKDWWILNLHNETRRTFTDQLVS